MLSEIDVIQNYDSLLFVDCPHHQRVESVDASTVPDDPKFLIRLPEWLVGNPNSVTVIAQPGREHQFLALCRKNVAFIKRLVPLEEIRNRRIDRTCGVG